MTFISNQFNMTSRFNSKLLFGKAEEKGREKFPTIERPEDKPTVGDTVIGGDETFPTLEPGFSTITLEEIAAKLPDPTTIKRKRPLPGQSK